VCGLGMHSRGQLLLDRRKLGTGRAFLRPPLRHAQTKIPLGFVCRPNPQVRL
jgi:hypothetical protein